MAAGPGWPRGHRTGAPRGPGRGDQLCQRRAAELQLRGAAGRARRAVEGAGLAAGPRFADALPSDRRPGPVALADGLRAGVQRRHQRGDHAQAAAAGFLLARPDAGLRGRPGGTRRGRRLRFRAARQAGGASQRSGLRIGLPAAGLPGQPGLRAAGAGPRRHGGPGARAGRYPGRHRRRHLHAERGSGRLSSLLPLAGPSVAREGQCVDAVWHTCHRIDDIGRPGGGREDHR
ncbi:hypothetical protein D3C86_1545830 [compost metagenome]